MFGTVLHGGSRLPVFATRLMIQSTGLLEAAAAGVCKQAGDALVITSLQVPGVRDRCSNNPISTKPPLDHDLHARRRPALLLLSPCQGWAGFP